MKYYHHDVNEFDDFGSGFETIHNVSASQLEVLVEKPKRCETFQNTIQRESNSFTLMNIGSNNSFSNITIIFVCRQCGFGRAHGKISDT